MHPFNQNAKKKRRREAKTRKAWGFAYPSTFFPPFLLFPPLLLFLTFTLPPTPPHNHATQSDTPELFFFKNLAYLFLAGNCTRVRVCEACEYGMKREGKTKRAISESYTLRERRFKTGAQSKTSKKFARFGVEKSVERAFLFCGGDLQIAQRGKCGCWKQDLTFTSYHPPFPLQPIPLPSHRSPSFHPPFVFLPRPPIIPSHTRSA